MSDMDTLYYDGNCPLCLREIRVLQKLRDERLQLMDVHSYNPAPGEPTHHYQNPKVVTAVCLSGATLCCYANAPLTREKDSGLSPPASWKWVKLLNGERFGRLGKKLGRGLKYGHRIRFLTRRMPIEASTTSGDREYREIALSMALGSASHAFYSVLWWPA
jgi:hypothetical protein